MEPVLRVCAAAVCALLTALLLKKTNPELALLLTMSAVLVIAAAGLAMTQGLRQLRELLSDSFGLSERYALPVLKCVAAAIITKLTAELCRDASQSATAAAVELAGTACALGILSPLLIHLLKTLGGWL